MLDLNRSWSRDRANFSDSFFSTSFFFDLEKQYVGWWASHQYCFQSSPGFFWPPWRSLARIMISADKEKTHVSSGKMLENAALCKQISYKGIWHPGAWTFAKSWLKWMRGSGSSQNLSPLGYFQVSQVPNTKQCALFIGRRFRFSARKIRVGDLVEIKLDRSNISGRHFGTVKSLMNSKLFCVECGAEAPGFSVSWEG